MPDPGHGGEGGSGVEEYAQLVLASIALAGVVWLASVGGSQGAEAGLLALLAASSGSYYRRPVRPNGNGNGTPPARGT